MQFNDEQLRALVNLSQAYEYWMESLRGRQALPYGMRWKTVSGREYLYEVRDRIGNAQSLGPRAPQTEAKLGEYRTKKADLDKRIEATWSRVHQSSKICRALQVPAIAQEAAKILVELDLRRMLGTHCTVAGTNAILAYNMEAAGPIIIGADMATDDFDLMWARDHPTSIMLKDGPPSILAALKAVDETYTVNEERPFQLRNRSAYEVEILVPPSQIDTLPKGDRIRPAQLDELEWLLLGEPIAHVVPAKGDSVAKIVAPDPRMFALQKLWLSEKPTRSALKRPKDRRQGDGLLDACGQGQLPRHPLSAEFIEKIPDPLRPHWVRWATARGFVPPLKVAPH
jgi:hypothetical protein